MEFKFTDSVQIAKEIHNTVNRKGRRAKKPFYKKLRFWITVVTIVMLVKKIYSLENDLMELNEKLFFTKEKEKSDTTDIQDTESESVDDFENNVEEESVPGVSEDTELADNKEKVFKFIINKSAKKYHTRFCSGVSRMAENKRDYVEVNADSFEQAQQKLEDKGYNLCGVCKRG